MRTVRRRALRLFLLLASIGYPFHAACPFEAHLPETARVVERILGLPGLVNVGRVAPGILRGGQPEPEGYVTLRRMGIRTVINLRTRHDEREAVEAAGMRYLPIPISTMGKVDDRSVGHAVDALRDPGNLPLFVHCAFGEDRTGVVVAVYRMEAERWGNREAEAEMQAFGFNDVWWNLKEYVRRYKPASGGDAGKGTLQ